MNTQSPSGATKLTLIAITLLQGCLLLALQKLLENHLWLTGNPTRVYLLYTLVIGVPLTLAMVLRELRDKWPWLLALVYGAMLALVALYSGYQCEPADSVSCGMLVFAYVLTLGISWFIILFFIQTWLEQRSRVFSYTLLFDYSWQNYLTLKLAWVFVCIFWGILFLWAQLFDVLGIAFFKNLFKSEWFIYPVTGAMAGLGIVIFRFQINAVATLRGVLAALMRWLLPLLALVSLLFLLTLPFTGLAPLWKTGHGTMLLLWLVALVLFFTNAVYQDDAGKRPYGLVLHRVIQVAVVAQVFFVACCFYGLTLRVRQHGWTVDRLWGFIITLICSGFVLAYAASIVALRDQWLHWLKTANKAMAVGVAAICLAVNSPLLDFRKITVASQLARLEQGAIETADFDYHYFARELARPGYLALLGLKESELAKAHPGMIADIDAALTQKEYSVENLERQKGRKNLLDYVRVYPKQAQPTKELFDEVYQKVKSGDQCIKPSNCYLVEVDIDDVAGNEYILIISQYSWANSYVYGLEKDNWVIKASNGISLREEWKASAIRAALERGDFKAVPSQWKDFYIGDQRLQVR